MTDLRHHYWIVAGDASRVYSSLAGTYVPVADAAFQAWQAAGNVVTRIATVAELGEVLALGNGTIARPVDAAVLDAMSAAFAGGIARNPVFRVLFNHENRIRALAAQPSITMPQFVAAIRALL